MEKQTVLQAENLSIGYETKKQSTVVAADINFTIEPGKLTALIGANGIGKSTLLRTLTGIQKPLAGSVFIEGKTVGIYSASELAPKLSVVLTEKLPPSNLTV